MGIQCVICGLFRGNQGNSRRPKTDHHDKRNRPKRVRRRFLPLSPCPPSDNGIHKPEKTPCQRKNQQPVRIAQAGWRAGRIKTERLIRRQAGLDGRQERSQRGHPTDPPSNNPTAGGSLSISTRMEGGWMETGSIFSRLPCADRSVRKLANPAGSAGEIASEPALCHQQQKPLPAVGGQPIDGGFAFGRHPPMPHLQPTRRRRADRIRYPASGPDFLNLFDREDLPPRSEPQGQGTGLRKFRNTP